MDQIVPTVFDVSRKTPDEMIAKFAPPRTEDGDGAALNFIQTYELNTETEKPVAILTTEPEAEETLETPVVATDEDVIEDVKTSASHPDESLSALTDETKRADLPLRSGKESATSNSGGEPSRTLGASPDATRADDRRKDVLLPHRNRPDAAIPVPTRADATVTSPPSGPNVKADAGADRTAKQIAAKDAAAPASPPEKAKENMGIAAVAPSANPMRQPDTRSVGSAVAAAMSMRKVKSELPATAAPVAQHMSFLTKQHLPEPVVGEDTEARQAKVFDAKNILESARNSPQTMPDRSVKTQPMSVAAVIPQNADPLALVSKFLPGTQPPDPALMQEFGTTVQGTATVTATPSGTGVQSHIVATGTPETARAVAQQMAVAVQQTQGGATELELSPRELGRVRVVLSPQEVGYVVTIMTERPEVQDLMRRNIDLLAQEFRQMGYGETSFSFEQDAAHQDQGSDGTLSADQGASDGLVDDATLSTRLVVTSGLDLRL